VRGKHAREQIWFLREDTHYAFPKRPVLKQQHYFAHYGGTMRKRAMLALIARQISRDEAICKRLRLAKGQAEALAGNGINRARSVSDQSSVSRVHAL
jgi:hypothetical protein